MEEEQLESSEEKKNIFARIALFISQVFGQLRKVTVPSPKQLLNYTMVVLAFVIAMMLFVAALDLIFGQLVIWLFANKSN